MEDFNSTLSRHFFKGVCPTEKEIWGGLVRSCVCAPVALNRTISGEELGCYKWYQSLISSQKCASKDVESLRGVDCGVPHRLERGRLRSIYLRLEFNTIEAFY